MKIAKLLIKPSKRSVKTLLTNVQSIIKANPCAPAGLLITQLNSLIRGWAASRRHVVSKKVFEKEGHLAFHALWRWAKWHHRNKGARWVRNKYFGRFLARLYPFWAKTSLLCQV